MYKGYSINVLEQTDHYDEIENPLYLFLENHDAMLYFNRRSVRYDVSLQSIVDKLMGKSLEDYLNENYKYWRKIYFYSHSTMELSLTPYNDQFDSGLYGIVVCDKKVDVSLEDSIEETNALFRGEVYMYKIMNPSGEEIESAYGFIGQNSIDVIIEECKNIIDITIVDGWCKNVKDS